MVQLAFDCIFGWMGVTSRSSCSLSRYVLTRLQVVFVLAGHVTHVRAESVCPYYYLYCGRPRNDTHLHVKFYERRQLPQAPRWLAHVNLNQMTGDDIFIYWQNVRVNSNRSRHNMISMYLHTALISADCVSTHGDANSEKAEVNSGPERRGQRDEIYARN